MHLVSHVRDFERVKAPDPSCITRRDQSRCNGSRENATLLTPMIAATIPAWAISHARATSAWVACCSSATSSSAVRMSRPRSLLHMFVLHFGSALGYAVMSPWANCRRGIGRTSARQSHRQQNAHTHGDNASKAKRPADSTSGAEQILPSDKLALKGSNVTWTAGCKQDVP